METTGRHVAAGKYVEKVFFFAYFLIFTKEGASFEIFIV